MTRLAIIAGLIIHYENTPPGLGRRKVQKVEIQKKDWEPHLPSRLGTSPARSRRKEERVPPMQRCNETPLLWDSSDVRIPGTGPAQDWTFNNFAFRVGGPA